MTNDRGYPSCDNPECSHTLCFMDRRDWDECPDCGWPIPIHLRLDNEFKPVVDTAFIGLLD